MSTVTVQLSQEYSDSIGQKGKKTFENVLLAPEILGDGTLRITCNPHIYLLAPGTWFDAEYAYQGQESRQPQMAGQQRN